MLTEKREFFKRQDTWNRSCFRKHARRTCEKDNFCIASIGKSTYGVQEIIPATICFNARSTSSSISFNLSVITVIAVFVFLPLVCASSTPTSTSNTASISTIPIQDCNNTAVSLADDLPVLSEDIDTDMPRLAELRKRKRRKNRCPKKYRRDYCFNKGRCQWIKQLPICKCKKGWVGERCDETHIDLVEGGLEKENIIITVVVLAVFGFIGFTTVFCICWRRFRSVRNELEAEAYEKETEVMVKEQKENASLAYADESR
ncbi:uncharacterized protein LOC143471805 [Clavelina lepadiformis]|uniref:uncharacterized protein LOC143471805 n=1 Tax=Clavelina lepadiformis TaxID=159417 RepID=UPI00404121DA